MKVINDKIKKMEDSKRYKWRKVKEQFILACFIIMFAKINWYFALSFARYVNSSKITAGGYYYNALQIFMFIIFYAVLKRYERFIEVNDNE